MAGLLDFLDSDQARLGMGLLAAAGPTMEPMNFGQRLFGAMNMYRGQKAADEDRAFRQKYMEAQIGNLNSEADARRATIAEAQRMQALRQALPGMLIPQTTTDISPTPENAARQEAGVPYRSQTTGGLANMSAEQVATLEALTGLKLLDNWKAARQPEKIGTAGDIVQDPSGVQRQLMNDPRYLGQVAQQAGAVQAAQSGAQAPYQDPVRGPWGPNGAEVAIPRPQFAQMGVPGQIGQNFLTAPDPIDLEARKDAAKQASDQYKNISAAAMKAPQMISRYQQLDRLIGDFEGGKLSGLSMDAASMLNSLGIQIDPRLGGKQAADAITNEIALKLRNTGEGGGMPGSLSDSDRNFLKAMTPQVGMTAQGRQILLQSGVALARRDQDIYGMATKWMQRYGRLDAANPSTGKNFFQNLSEWSNTNPLFGDIGKQ